MSTLSRPPFIVVGTGRCGTNSITEIIGSCKNAYVTHEEHYLSWYDHSDPEIGDIIKDAKSHSRRGVSRGFVGYMYLPHVPTIRSAIRNLKVVHLWREKEDTVKSFLSFKNFTRPKDRRKWQDKSSGPDSLDFRVTRSFPLIDGCSVEQAFGFYWEMYQKMAWEYLSEPIFRMHTKDLNETSSLDEMCDFLGIPPQDRIFPENKQRFTTKEIHDKQVERYIPVDRSIRHELESRPA